MDLKGNTEGLDSKWENRILCPMDPILLQSLKMMSPSQISLTISRILNVLNFQADGDLPCS